MAVAVTADDEPAARGSCLYPTPHPGLDFKGRPELTAAELVPTAQQSDVGGSGQIVGLVVAGRMRTRRDETR